MRAVAWPLFAMALVGGGAFMKRQLFTDTIDSNDVGNLDPFIILSKNV